MDGVLLDFNVFPQAAAFLIIYWFIFWHRFLFNPYLLCTSEIASTFFPHWLWMGRQLKAGVFPAQDDIYYKLPGSIPFLATFYPPNLLTAYIGSFFKEDFAFKIYAYFILIHYLLTSFFAYHLFGNLFAAITLTYAGYVIKPNTPTFVFTATWIPLALKGGILGALAFNMSLLGGYYPILVYILPIVAIMAPNSIIWGSLLALPQLLPFIGYFKKSVRMGEKTDRNFGRLNWWRIFDLFIPNRPRGTMNGVHFTEYQMYMGIAILFIFHRDSWWVCALGSLLVCLGLFPPIQRIPSRGIYLLMFALSNLLVHSPIVEQASLSLVFLQSFLLLYNSSIYPSFPFTQWWDRPSKLYIKKPKFNNWPFVTGYLKGERISEYQGAFRLRTA